jgi:hypothetical protein
LKRLIFNIVSVLGIFASASVVLSFAAAVAALTHSSAGAMAGAAAGFACWAIAWQPIEKHWIRFQDWSEC